MKKALVFSAVVLICSHLFGKGNIDVDKYKGLSLEEVIKSMGVPASLTERIINETYIGYENEPDYSLFFSPEELKESIAIKIAKWESRKKTTLMWLKLIDKSWVIFSSVQFSDSVHF